MLSVPTLRGDISSHEETSRMWLCNAKSLIRDAHEPRRWRRTRKRLRVVARICLDHALLSRECARLLREGT